MSTKGKEVVTTKAGALAVPDKARTKDAFEGDASDILIPKLLMGQSTSKAVQAEKVVVGQIYRSTTLEVVGGRDKPISVIPLTHSKTWVILEKVGGKFEFRRMEPFTPENAQREWEWKAPNAKGVEAEWKAEKSLNFFVLLPGDIMRDLEAREQFAKTGDLPDTEHSLLPCAISFKSTSYKAGKTLVTHFAKAADFGVKPYVTTYQISSEKVTNDKSSFYVFTVAKQGKTESKLIDACDKWREIVRSTEVKVDDADLAEVDVAVDVVMRSKDGTVSTNF